MPHSTPTQRPWGAILAGGPGTRLGGGKPFRQVGGQRLIDRALANLSRACDRVLVVTGDVAACADLPCAIIADRWPGQGPLAALATAFLDSEAPGLVLMAVDLPLVPPAMLQALAAAHGRHRALAAKGPLWPEPLLAYYNRDCLPAALRLIKLGEQRPRILLKVVGAAIMTQDEVDSLDPGGESFLNVNYPADLERAAALLAQRGL